MVELNYKKFVIFWICEILSTTFIISGTMKIQTLTTHSIQHKYSIPLWVSPKEGLLIHPVQDL